jgi:hypothetical protein
MLSVISLLTFCAGATECYAYSALIPDLAFPLVDGRECTVDWRNTPFTLITPDAESGARLVAALRETAPITGRSVTTQTAEDVFLFHAGERLTDIDQIDFPEEWYAEGYFFSVDGPEILVHARSERGLFYGVMTLEQVLRGAERCGGSLQGIVAGDNPDIAMRGPHEDFGRDQLPTMEDLKRSIRTVAQYKMNTYLWFIEPDHFVYEFDPNISTDYDRFTFDEIRELVAYATSLYVEVIPVVELLAHMEMTLRHDRYKHLSETGDGGGTLCPTSDESFELVKKMIDEIAPAFGARYFHCGLDESQVVGTGRSADAVAEKGIEQVYADYYTRVNDAVKAHGQTMIMYADIVLNHPGILDLLPKDIVMMFWDYMPRERYEGLDKLKAMGYPVMSLSGLWDWNNLYPVYPPGFKNMQVLAKQTEEVGGLGHFVSNWGDGYRGAAGINLSELNDFGFIYCGVVSWDTGELPLEKFSERFAQTYYGVYDDAFAEALTRLARCQGDDLSHTTQARRMLHDDARQQVLAMVGQGEDALAFWRSLKAESEAAHAVIAQTQAPRNADYLRSVALAARILTCAADMALTYHAVAQGLGDDAVDSAMLVQQLKDLEARHRALWEEYRVVYAATNRPLNLNHIGASWKTASDEIAALAADISSGGFPPVCEKALLSVFDFDGDGERALREQGPRAMTLQPMTDRPQPEIVAGGPSGGGNFLRLPHGAHLEATDTTGTLNVLFCPVLVEAWVRHTGQREQQYGATIFSYGLGGGFRLGINQRGEALFTLYGIGETAGTKSIVPPDGQWHHVAVNFHDARLVDYYIDGQPTEQLELRGYPRQPATPLIRIGNEIALVTAFEGDIDRIRVSRGIYSAAELDSAP